MLGVVNIIYIRLPFRHAYDLPKKISLELYLNKFIKAPRGINERLKGN